MNLLNAKLKKLKDKSESEITEIEKTSPNPINYMVRASGTQSCMPKNSSPQFELSRAISQIHVLVSSRSQVHQWWVIDMLVDIICNWTRPG